MRGSTIQWLLRTLSRVPSKVSSGAGGRQVARAFNSKAEHDAWVVRIKASAEPRPSAVSAADTATAAPFLFSVDPMAGHLEIFAAPPPAAKRAEKEPRPPSASMVEVRYPLARDEALRHAVADVGKTWSTFRLSKWLEAVDAITADVAYRHTDGEARGLALVTAAHNHSRKLRATDTSRDVLLRSYVTAAGTSSLEVRTDALQWDPCTGREVLINVCHTTMVALDQQTMRPRRPAEGFSAAVPPLAFEAHPEAGAEAAEATAVAQVAAGWAAHRPVSAATARQEERTALSQWHQTIRKRRHRNTMEIREPLSTPPTADEMVSLHKMHRISILTQEQPRSTRPPPPRTVQQLTFRSSFVVFPEKRNVHGKLFGGFVAAQAFDLAYYAARFFAGASAVAPLGLDEALFLQPINIGDMVTFTARVVHATANTCRVFVAVEVRDPADSGRLPRRSNRLVFSFAIDNDPKEDGAGGDAEETQTVGGDGATAEPKARATDFILPGTYSEILMHFKAARISRSEGPTDEEARAIMRQASEHQLKNVATSGLPQAGP